MVGYLLKNTVTDNGSVARGVCASDEQGNLTVINERTRIEKYPGGIHYTEDDGQTWVDLPENTLVSMNTVSYTHLDVYKRQGTTVATNSALYWISFGVLILVTALISFGGIRKVTKVTDLLVPIMAVIYVLTVVVLVVCNIGRIPWFFGAVFGQAFRPEAVFGGAFGVALSQGIKRGLMSNEAGQGTITMPAAEMCIRDRL